VLVIDSDPQIALTRQMGTEEGSLAVNFVDVLAGHAGVADAIVTSIHGVDVIAAAPALAGVEISLVGELGRERFLTDALEPMISEYDEIVIDTPPNLGLLTVNALVVAAASSRRSAPRTTHCFTESANCARRWQSSQHDSTPRPRS
jgi:chromosome partitioning protein